MMTDSEISAVSQRAEEYPVGSGSSYLVMSPEVRRMIEGRPFRCHPSCGDPYIVAKVLREYPELVRFG